MCFIEIGFGCKFFFIDLRFISILLNCDFVDIFFIFNFLLLIGCLNLIKIEMILYFDECLYIMLIFCVYVEVGLEFFRNVIIYFE